MIRAASFATFCAVTPSDQPLLHETCRLAISYAICSRMRWYVHELSYIATAFMNTCVCELNTDEYAQVWELARRCVRHPVRCWSSWGASSGRSGARRVPDRRSALAVTKHKTAACTTRFATNNGS
jgi:hypothetical protein